MRTFLAAALALGALAATARASAPDPLIDAQWGLHQVRAPAAWDLTKGAGAVVAVIDSGGIDFSHPDLVGKKLGGIRFSSCGSLGCGDGSWHSFPADGPHATWVAGVVAATEGNGVGIAGVAPDVKLLSVDVGPGLLVSDIVLGITWAVAKGADVINLSLGRAGLYGTSVPGAADALGAALHAASAAGVTVVAASGNHTYPFSLVTPPGAYPHVPVLCADPASRPNVICVSATDRRELPSLVYTGLPITEGFTAVSAPGGLGLGSTLSGESCAEAILTTHPTGMPKTCPTPAGYEAVDGTSFAAPHAAGVAALLASMGCGYDAIRAIMLTTSRTPPLDTRGTYSPMWGYGIVDARLAVGTAADTC